ncbi:MAG: LacI family DNA-binding transcriptional regulator, partial [Candidatus Dormibacteraceae bacterium]
MSSESQGRVTRATLAEVAGLAGVSVSTVSKVLNGRAGISKATRARVESLLQDRQYNRRNSSQAIAPIIEVLLYEIHSPFGGETIASIERISRERDVAMVVSGANADHRPSPRWVDGVLRRHPLGVILVASELLPRDKQRLRARNIPIVMIDPSGAPATDAPAVGSADWHGGFLATQHLIDLAHRSIAII